MSSRFPPANADQVLCKQNQLRLLKERQAKWFQQRAAEERRAALEEEKEADAAAGDDDAASASLQTHGRLPVPAAPSDGTTWSAAERQAQRRQLSELRRERDAVKEALLPRQGSPVAMERTAERHTAQQGGMLLLDAVGTSGMAPVRDLVSGAGVGELPQRPQQQREEEEEEAQVQRALLESLMHVAPGCRDIFGGSGGDEGDGLHTATPVVTTQWYGEHTGRDIDRAASHHDRIEQQLRGVTCGDDGDELRELDLELERMEDFLLAVRLAADEGDV